MTGKYKPTAIRVLQWSVELVWCSIPLHEGCHYSGGHQAHRFLKKDDVLFVKNIFWILATVGALNKWGTSQWNKGPASGAGTVQGNAPEDFHITAERWAAAYKAFPPGWNCRPFYFDSINTKRVRDALLKPQNEFETCLWVILWVTYFYISWGKRAERREYLDAAESDFQVFRASFQWGRWLPRDGKVHVSEAATLEVMK